jgi:hypothetical protein
LVLLYSFTLWILFLVITIVVFIVGGYSRGIPDLVLRVVGLISSTCLFILSILPQRYIFFNANDTITTVNVTVDFSPTSADILSYLWTTISLLLMVLSIMELIVTEMRENE